MADWMKATPEERCEWQRMVEREPAGVRRLSPWALYRDRSTGLRVTLHSVEEDGTVTVIVSGRFNLLRAERVTFGVDPADLEECDLPHEGELVGLGEPAAPIPVGRKLAS